MSVSRRDQNRLATAYADMPDEYLLCRDPALKHRMNIVNDLHKHVHKGDPRMLLARDMECERCTTKRKDVFLVYTDGSVEKLRSSYQYPEGYTVRGVVQGIKPSILVYTEMYERVQAAQKAAKRKKRAASGGRKVKAA